MSRVARFAWLALVALAGCDELGNPVAGTGAEAGYLVRTSDSVIGPLVTEIREVDPTRVDALVASLGRELDHLDRTVPAGGSVVLVTVRAAPDAAHPPELHLVTDFVLPGSLVERRIWVARGASYVGIFGLREKPIDVKTTTL